MASSVGNPRRSVGFFANAVKNKDSFIQFFAVTGMLLLSMRSTGQKYRANNLREDTSALKEEQQALTDRIDNIKCSLRTEAALQPSGIFASRLSLLFGDDH